MEMAKSVVEYFDKHENWQAEMDYLRQLLLSTELKETVKWGMPTYTVNNKNVIGIGAFKSYVGLWFFQGVFLSDFAGVLQNASDGKTKAMRQWRFNSIEDMNSATILAYIQESIQNQKDGKEVKVERRKTVDVPAELSDALNADQQLKVAFEALSPGKKNEYAEHIGSAKQEATRLKRLDKAIPLILEGKGLMDKYRK